MTSVQYISNYHNIDIFKMIST